MSETALKLRSNKFSSTKLTAPTAGYTAGQIVRVSDTTFVIVDTAAVGAETAAIYKAEKIVLPKGVATADVFSVGEKVYFDESEGNLCGTSGGNILCGRALVAAGQADTTVEIELDGTLA